ncbi:MAG TPA: N-6 DNA methylase [Solirubrobacterales bacterium]|nr:N-6 DNA methylase [Solirubrobacterales bacterium]
MSLQRIAADLHKAAAVDLAARPEKWGEVPTNGLVRDLIAARTGGPVPFVHLSSAGGRLAVLAVVAEMGERAESGRARWQADDLSGAADALNAWVPNLCESHLGALASDLPALREASGVLRLLDDAELAHLVGRTMESATSCYWVFGDHSPPRRAWHPWVAKQQGCFFTPRFVAAHIASAAVGGKEAPLTLDPAVGAGALLVECFLKLRSKSGSQRALESLFGVDRDPAFVELTALTLAFIAGQWRDERPALLGTQLVVGDSLLAPLDGPTSWKSWFPEIVGTTGFDAVVMNPPYGQLKVNQSSLPARRGDDQATAAIRERALNQARHRVTETAAALRRNPDYSFAHGGIPDLPRFFVERALSLLRAGGNLACIVPSTFMADHRSRRFRRFLLDSHSLRELALIPEDAHLFAGVNQPTCVLVAQAHRSSSRIRIRRQVRTPSDLKSKADATVTRQLIMAVDPVDRRMPNCSADDIELLQAMHEHPRLDEHPWIANLRGELDLTSHAGYVRSEPTGVPLIRGDQIERFRADLPSDKHRWVDQRFLVDGISPPKAPFVSQPRIVLRQCSYLRKPNRISGSLVQAGHVVANSCNFLAIDHLEATVLDRESSLLYLLGIINSRLIDWRFRMTSSTNHVGNYELAALPIPSPARESAGEIAELTAALLKGPDRSSVDEQLELAVRSLYGLKEPDA